MKRHIILSVSLAAVMFSSCIKQIEKKFTGTPVAELDAAVVNSVASGVNYPILSRIPPAGRQPATIDSTLRRLNGIVRIRINLVGPHFAEDRIVGYRTFNSPITTFAFPATISGQTPTQTAGTVAVSTAVAGNNYEALSGRATIPAGSSFGFININMINNGSTAGQARFIGITLDSTGTILPSVNYNSLGLVIDQR